jgi:hypothetical protein
MCKYDDVTMEPIPPTLAPGEQEHVLVPQDECIVNVNEGPRRRWLKGDQQPLKKKGNGRAIHICGWICETTGHLRLSDEQVAAQSELPEAQQLKVTDSRKIIYPGKNHDGWWDLKQLMDQMTHAIDIFEYLHPDKVAIWLFDCSSAHEGLAEDALNVNNMNVNPGGKQRHLRTTTIPTNNPPPKPGRSDTRGRLQEMVYPPDHPDPNLRGLAKGMKAVLQERESVWDELVANCNGRVVGKCKECSKSQAKRDAERRVADAEAMGQEDTLADDDVMQAQDAAPTPVSDWCCMYRVLSLQEDFTTEKPMLQHYIEGRGHICMFLPKFHCELNPIGMLWGYAKYRESLIYYIYYHSFFSGYRNVSDGKFATAKRIVPACLDMCDTLTIRRFFRKAWRYMDAYLCVLVFFIAVGTHICAIQQGS